MHERFTNRRTVLKGIGTSVILGGMATTATAKVDKRVVLGPHHARGANGVATSEAANTGRGSFADTDEKFFLWLNPGRGPANLGSFTVEDIQELAFHTKTDHAITGSTPLNFYVSIYTEPDGVDDTASWYGYRLNGEPYFSRALDAPADEWIRWSTSPGDNQLTFFDAHNAELFGFYGQPSLPELQAGPVNWQEDFGYGKDKDIDYGAETVKALAFATGSSWADEFEGYLDTIEIALSSGPGRSAKGQSVVVDLEPGR